MKYTYGNFITRICNWTSISWLNMKPESRNWKSNILPFVAGVLDRFCLKYDDTPDDRFEEHPLDPIVLSLSDAGL